MSFVESRSKISLAVVAAFSLLLQPSSATAVVNIRSDTWTSSASGSGLPETRHFELTFDADLTSYDVYNHLGFSICGPGWNRHVETLLSPNRGTTTPANVWTARFRVTFDLGCGDTPGSVRVTDATCSMRYTDPGAGLETSRAIELEGVQIARSFRSFELYVVDDERRAGWSSIQFDMTPCPEDQHSLGVYFDPEGTICQGTIRPGVPGTVYVVAKLDAEASPIAGTEFAFGGVPESWSTFPVANPAIVAIGNPFEGGVTAGFTCWPRSSGPLVLYRVLVLAADDVANVRFELGPRTPSSNPAFTCPLLVECGPVFPAFCVDSRPCFVNSRTPAPCAAAPTAVNLRSWGEVKALYGLPDSRSRSRER